MATVKNEVFIGLLHENFNLVGKELCKNCSRCRVNEQIFREWGDYPYPPVGKTLLICIYVIYIKHIMHNHTLFILHILTYDFLRILPFLEIWISVSVVGVGNILFV